MIEPLLYAFITLFVIIDPVVTAVVFAGMMRNASDSYRRRTARRAVFLATAILTAFGIGGKFLLARLGIGLPAFQVAGGILLFLLATDMVFARPSGMRTTTSSEDAEAGQKEDISVFPLAFPLIAGPGAMTSLVLLMSRAEGNLTLQAGVLATMVAVLLITLVLLGQARRVDAVLGVTGTNVISRVLGIILAALAAQLVLDGLTAALLRA